MYRFYSPLYLAPTVKNTWDIKLKLRMNRHLPDVFLVLICQDNDQLEIINAEVLRQQYYRQKKNHVIGIAHFYIEAVDIIKKITEECVKKNGDADLRRYLNEYFSDKVK